jgi:hypothetical protein
MTSTCIDCGRALDAAATAEACPRRCDSCEEQATSEREYERASADVLLPLGRKDAEGLADALEFLAGVDDGEHTDFDWLMRMGARIRGLIAEEARPAGTVADGRGGWAEGEHGGPPDDYMGNADFQAPEDYGRSEPDRGALPAAGARVRLLHDVDRYPHFLAPAGSRGTVAMSDGEIFSVRLDEPLAGAEAWDNEIVWSLRDGDDPSEDVAEGPQP